MLLSTLCLVFLENLQFLLYFVVPQMHINFEYFLSEKGYENSKLEKNHISKWEVLELVVSIKILYHKRLY